MAKKRQARGRAQEAAAPQGAGAGQNPYEVFQNRRRRRAVLGERVRGEKRNVAKSRAAATSDRTQSLVKDSLSAARTSRFSDLRLGAGKEGLGGVQRLVKIRQRQAKKSFALVGGGGAEELTHGGRGISAIPDEELKQSGAGDSDEDVDDAALAGDDPIAIAKMQKEEAAKEREEQGRMLGELDNDFGSILGELQFRPKKKDAPLGDRSEPDGYDMLVRKLGQERTAMATERTKTAEEIAREKVERLEALERSRLARAEDADAAHDAEEVGQEDAGDGQALAALTGPGVPVDGDEDGAEADEGAEEEEEDQDATDDEGEEEEGSGKSEEEEGGEAAGKAAEEGDQDEDDRQGEQCASFLPARSEVDIMANEEGEDGLPFAPACPGDRFAVDALLGAHPPRTCLKLVQRVRACTSAALDAGNKKKLQGFFAALVDYVLHAVARSDGDISARGLQVAYALRGPLVELAGENPEQAHEYFAARLRAMDPSTVPRAAEFSCLKLVALIFPVTDFQHPIATPAALLADHWAAQIARLGAGIEDLVSDSLLLWEVLYEFVIPAQRFSAPFFQLGLALLESCLASADAGRSQCGEAAVDVVRLLSKALRTIAEADAASAHVVADVLVRPVLQRVSSRKPDEGSAPQRLHRFLSELGHLCDSFRSTGFTPLSLFEAPPPQIRTLDPIFHEAGDRNDGKGAELTERQLLKRKLTQERRSATRQLARDAAVLQQLQFRKDEARSSARSAERKRVRTMMAVEKQELRKLQTENTFGMDTSLKRYSAKKEDKKNNRRLGGNAMVQGDKKPAGSAEGARKDQFNAAAAAGPPRAKKGKKPKKGKH